MASFSSVPDRSGTGSLKWDRYPEGILPMWVADMDFPSPDPVIEALHRRVDHRIFGYTIPFDDPVEAVLEYLAATHQVSVEAETLFWLPGLVPALNLIARAFAGPGKAVMTATPIYPPFLSAPVNAGSECIRVPLRRDRDQRWTFDFAAMEESVTPTTTVFFLCNPHNPVGRVFTRDELLRVAEFCERHDLLLVSDEIHCDLILDEDKRHLPCHLLGERFHRRLISLYAPSKTFNLAGLACAYAVIPDPAIRRKLQREAQGIVTEINAFGYVACAAAYREGGPWLHALRNVLRTNRDELVRRIAPLQPKLRVEPVEATYLAWIDARGLGLKDPAEHFEKHGLGLSDGNYFGTPGWVRLNFGCPPATLRQGLDLLENAVHQSTS